jgi:hypothetical protein
MTYMEVHIKGIFVPTLFKVCPSCTWDPSQYHLSNDIIVCTSRTGQTCHTQALPASYIAYGLASRYHLLYNADTCIGDPSQEYDR